LVKKFQMINLKKCLMKQTEMEMVCSILMNFIELCEDVVILLMTLILMKIDIYNYFLYLKYI